MKRVGIVGGLGPETCCEFLLAVNREIEQKMGCQADVVMENVAMPHNEMKKLAAGSFSTFHKDILAGAISRLHAAQVDFIVIPCNTMHIFIDDLRKISKIPIVSIIDETAKECLQQQITKVGILGSSTTIQQKLHETKLHSIGIETVIPSREDQSEMGEIIPRIIFEQNTKEDEQTIVSIIRKMKIEGADAVILGCTDLPLVINEQNSVLPIIDTR